MGDQSQNQGDRSFQSMMNPNSYSQNMNQMVPPQMANLDNSMMSATGGNTNQTSQMFEMFNMFKMMMINQNGGQMNPNTMQSMMGQVNAMSNNLGNRGMSSNIPQMGMNSYGAGANVPSQYQSQQSQPPNKQNSSNNLNNTITRDNMDNAFRNVEDRFASSQQDIQSFYDHLSKQNQSPINPKNNNNPSSNNQNLFSKKSNPQMMGNNSNNVFDVSTVSEQQLPFKSEYVEYDNHFEQSQNMNNFQNKQSFASVQNARVDDSDFYGKNQGGPYQKNGGSSVTSFKNDDMKYNQSNINNERFGGNNFSNINNNNNERNNFSNNNDRMNAPMNNKKNNNADQGNFNPKLQHLNNVNPSVVSEDNEFLRDSIVNMHQNQLQNQYGRNQQSHQPANNNNRNNQNNQYGNENDYNEYADADYGIKKNQNVNNQKSKNFLSDNDQQYLMSHLSPINTNQNHLNEDRPNHRAQNDVYPPLSSKSQQNNRQFDNYEDDTFNQYLPNKNNRQNFQEEERQLKVNKNQRVPYDQYEQEQPLPPQKQNNNKNSQYLNKNNYMDDERPIQKNNNNNFVEEERPIKSSKNQINNNNIGNESDRSHNQNSQRNYNPLDDMPIKSNAGFKRFEDLIEEKMRQEGEDDNYDTNSRVSNRKKTFLKKGSRAFLSNGQQRSKAAQGHIEEIDSQQNGGAEQPKPKKVMPVSMKSASSLSKPELFSSNQNNFNNKPVGGANKLSQIHSMGGLDNNKEHMKNDDNDKSSAPKEKKKFLQRGKGKGGGVQGYKKEELNGASGTQSQTQIGKEVNEKQPQGNQQKKNDKKQPQAQSQKQKKHSDLISMEDDDDYTPANRKKVRNSDDEFDDDENNFEEKEYGNKKYQPFKYMNDNQDDDQEFEPKQNKGNSRPPTNLGNQNSRKDSEDTGKNKFNNKNEGPFQFDDEEEWGDDSNTRKNAKNKFTKNEEKKSNKLNIHDSDAGSDKDEDDEFKENESNLDDDNDDPDQQYSKVVQKYFNKKGPANPKTSSSQGPNSQRAPGSVSLHDLTAEQKRQIIQEFSNDQIEQLNSEISKVKLENERVKRMRSKYEDLLKTLNKEKEQFSKQKEMEIQELEEFKKEEKKKILNEKRISDRQQKAMQNMPNRKEREEIENLKALNKKLQEEIKIKDQRNKLTIDRQKKLIDELTQKNQELKDELKHLENMRLDGGSSNTNKQTNLNKANSTKQAQKNAPSKSPYKEKPNKNLGEESYYNEDQEEEEAVGYSQNYQKNKQKKNSAVKDASKKRNNTYSNSYDYQYDNNTAKYHDDDNFKYGKDYDQDDQHYNDHQDEEDEQFENYENYQRDPSASKGSKQSHHAQYGNNIDDSQDYENHHAGKQNDEQEDEHLETYEDIINFNPNSHTYNENKKGKNEIKQISNLKQQHSSEFPQTTNTVNKNRLNSKSNSISIQNSNNNNATNMPNAALSSANKNDKKKVAQLEKSEKENKSQAVGSGNQKQQQQQPKQQKQNNNLTKQKSFVYDISTISSAKNMSIRLIGEEIDRSQFHYDKNIFYQEYVNSLDQPNRIASENITQDGKIQTTYEDGKQQVQFANGVKRQVFPNGYTLVNFINEDVKQVLPDHTVIYYFADAQTTQTTMANNINIYNFPNSQIEIHFPSGKKEIKFGDGTEKYIYEDGEEKTFFADGTVQTVDLNKVKKIRYKNGKEDVIYPDQNGDNMH